MVSHLCELFHVFFHVSQAVLSGKPHVICWALKWFLICVSSHRFFLSGECPVASWACKQFFTSVCSFMDFRLLCINITLFFSCVCRPLVTFRACKWFLRFRLLNTGKWLVACRAYWHSLPSVGSHMKLKSSFSYKSLVACGTRKWPSPVWTLSCNSSPLVCANLFSHLEHEKCFQLNDFMFALFTRVWFLSCMCF